MASSQHKRVPMRLGFVRLPPTAVDRAGTVDEAAATPPPPAAALPAIARWQLPEIFVSNVLPASPLATAARKGTLQPGAERRIAIGSDHGGFRLKKTLIELLGELSYEPEDCGTYSQASCDYPDFARKVGDAVRSGLCVLGIMIDGAGIGSAMALNKMNGIRAATVHSEATAVNSREHNDANVLVLGSGTMHPGHARRIVRIWLSTEHAGGRHAARVAKIMALERT